MVHKHGLIEPLKMTLFEGQKHPFLDPLWGLLTIPSFGWETLHGFRVVVHLELKKKFPDSS